MGNFFKLTARYYLITSLKEIHLFTVGQRFPNFLGSSAVSKFFMTSRPE